MGGALPRPFLRADDAASCVYTIQELIEDGTWVNVLRAADGMSICAEDRTSSKLQPADMMAAFALAVVFAGLGALASGIQNYRRAQAQATLISRKLASGVHLDRHLEVSHIRGSTPLGARRRIAARRIQRAFRAYRSRKRLVGVARELGAPDHRQRQSRPKAATADRGSCSSTEGAVSKATRSSRVV